MFWARVSEWPGCFASGETLDEVMDALEEANRQGRRVSSSVQRLAFRALQGSRHHARHARRGKRAGLAPDPITRSRATIGIAGSRRRNDA
jgi:hypothetical protein